MQTTTFEGIIEAVRVNEKSRMTGLFKATRVADSLLTPGRFVSFAKPLDVLVSRWFPGYRLSDLSGPGADESVGVLLATALTTDEALDSFRRIMATPSVAIGITNVTLPRAGVPVKRGKGYLVAEHKLARIVAEQLGQYQAGPAVVAALTHVFTRIFSKMNIVQPGLEEKTVNTSEGFAINVRELRRFILIEAMRDLFTEQRIAMATRNLNEDATPEIIGETIARLLRDTARLIPEIKLRLEQLDIAISVVRAYHLNPNTLSKKMQASTSLQTLASYANFMADAQGSTISDLPTYANADLQDAVDNVLKVISAAPSMEPMPMSKYVDMFGFLPAASSEGLYRGAVAYLPLGQTSRMDVADYIPRPAGCELQLVPTEYVPTSTIATELTRTLVSPAAMTAVANIIADELTQTPADIGDAPLLYTMGLAETDLLYLAMGMSEFTSIVVSDGPGRLVFGVEVSDQWLMRVQAATPGVAYFDDPAAAVVYMAPKFKKEPAVMPSRQQHLGLSASFDQMVNGDISRYIVDSIEEPFNFKLNVRNPSADGGQTTLDLRVMPMRLMVGTNGEMADRGESKFVAIREPGVDRDLEMVLTAVHHYIQSENVDLSDTAKSWLIANSVSLVIHPAIEREAIRAMNQAIKDAGLDGRKLQAQLKSVVIRAYFGTLVGVLARFGKIPTALAAQLLKDLPVDGLTTQAKLAASQIPTTLNMTQLIG